MGLLWRVKYVFILEVKIWVYYGEENMGYGMRFIKRYVSDVINNGSSFRLMHFRHATIAIMQIFLIFE